MSAHPWLHEMPWPTNPMPRPQLEDSITRLLTRTNMGVVSTLDENGDVNAAPLEFHAEGLNIFIYPQPGSSKMANIRRNPNNIAFTVNLPYYSWASTEGLQMKADAIILEPGTPEHEHGLEIFKWEFTAVELGRDLSIKPTDPVVLLKPKRIQYTCHWLRKDKYAPRQIWEAHTDNVSVWKAAAK